MLYRISAIFMPGSGVVQKVSEGEDSLTGSINLVQPPPSPTSKIQTDRERDNLTLRPDTLLSKLDFLAFDVETTGLSAIACRIVELSGVRFGPCIQSDGQFSRLINPGCAIPPEVSKIHGISDEMVKDAQPACEVLSDFLQFSEGLIWMAHNAVFDVEFVKVELTRNKLPLPRTLVLDTLTLAQNVLYYREHAPANYKLKTLSEFFGFAGDEYHRALSDSIYVEKLFNCLLATGGIHTVGELMAAGAVKEFSEWLAPVCRNSLPVAIQEVLQTLEAAIEKEHELEIKYQGEYVYKRKIRPQAVLESRGSLYLSAHCHKAKAERTFRVDRIVEARTIK